MKPSVAMVTSVNFEHLPNARHFAKQFTSVLSFNLYENFLGCHLTPLNAEFWVLKPEDLAEAVDVTNDGTTS